MSRVTLATKTCAYCHRTFSKDPRNTWAYWERAKYCSQQCAGNAQTARLAAQRLPLREDFARWFDRPEDGCWEWKGARSADGYGAYSYKKKSYRAHRLALELDGRPVPDGMYACHHCDNPICVRPDHLYVGTPTDNMRDAKKRNRLRPARKLTESDVLAIRASKEPVKALAAKYGVTHGAISMARSGKTWGSV